MKKIFSALSVFLLCLSSWGAEIPIRPDLNVTPGEFCSAADIDFHEYRYSEKMPYCQRNVWESLKNRIYAVYKIPANCKHRYTIDHMVPLALGGNNDPRNLWPEHILVKATRQALENELYWRVREGLVSSEQAVQELLEAKTKLTLDLSHVDGCG